MNRRIVAVGLSILVLAGAFTGCSRTVDDTIKPMNSTKLSKEAEKNIILKDGLSAEYISGQKNFDFQLFGKMKGDENVFLSPYSISSALSMLYNGAEGNTRMELAKLLGYQLLPGYAENYSSESNQQMNAQNKYLLDTLQKADPKVKLAFANSIWLAKGEQFADSIDQSLLEPVRNYYNGDIFSVDFTGEGTLKQVNSWVSDHTDSMIDPFLQQFSSPEAMRILLINAIYFNGKWSTPFSPDDTTKATFRGLHSDAEVDEMYLYGGEYRYYTAKGLQGLELPYGNGELVMDILLPENKDQSGIRETYDKLKTDEVDDFLQHLDKVYPVEISKIGLPKFTMEYGTVELKEILAELGMKDAFDKEKADFSLMGDNLFVSSVVHKAKIEVEEWGTKASAATGISVETTSALISDPLEFIVDVPFLFLIRDKQTDTILFMGQINTL